ncbi:MAG TPA: hypothetical protein VG603_13035 [Chitinophagales bacterium]|nr:hypothetical protein [Chitinophagales bacterium]
MKEFFKSAAIVIISVLVLSEIALRLTGKFRLYSEIQGLGYTTDYGKVLPTWYHFWRPDEQFIPADVDFQYPYHINRFGLREKELSETKSDSVTRILITGDSFVEGMGAPYDSTWPRLLETELKKRNYKVEVIDAGESGSDVFYDYVFYRDKLKNFKPDIVITSVNNTDFTDCMLRGCMERFHADSTVHFKPRPWYEPLYHVSHLVRGIMNKAARYPFLGLFVSKKEFVLQSREISKSMIALLLNYRQTVEKNGARFVTVLHSVPMQISNHNTINTSDSLRFAEINTALKNDSVNCFDIANAEYQTFANQPWQVYTYKHDKHFNPTGYACMARVVADSLIASGLLIKQ